MRKKSIEADSGNMTKKMWRRKAKKNKKWNAQGRGAGQDQLSQGEGVRA